MGKEVYHFVLVHGAMHGAWCWYVTVDLLQKEGHKVSAVDLTGCGIHPADPTAITEFSEYNKPLVDLLSSLPDNEKVVLVGHSMGGLSVTDAMEQFPHKLSAAVFLTAIMSPSGESLEKNPALATKLFSNPVVVDGFTFISGNGPENPPTAAYVDPKSLQDVFYHRSPSQDIALAAMLIRPCSMTVLMTAKTDYTVEGYGKVPKVFIKTLQDRVLDPDLAQDYYIKVSPPTEVREIDSDHSPFFSAPETLHRHLLEIAEKYSK